MTVLEIPLSPEPQRFRIQLGDTVYQLRVWWNDAREGGWNVDLADSNGTVLVGSIPLVTGADLLEQFAYLGTPGEILVQTLQDTDAVPTYENLGIASRLYLVPSS